MTGPCSPLLACLPHGGGVSGVYACWPAAFGGRADVLPVEYPGHGTRAGERPARNMDELLADILGVLGTPGRRPLAIFGHSFGATVGYELARVAQSAGWEVTAFIPSACVPPHVRPSPTARSGATLEGAAAVLAELGDIPSVLIGDSAYTDRASRLVAADSALLTAYSYRAGPLLSAPVLAVGGDADPVVELAALARWPELSAAGGEVRVLRGGHFYHLRRRQDLIAAISDWLAPGRFRGEGQGSRA